MHRIFNLLEALRTRGWWTGYPRKQVSQSTLELATVMRVRSNKPVLFSLIGVEEYRRMHALKIPEGRDVFKGLEDVLQRLSAPKNHE